MTRLIAGLALCLCALLAWIMLKGGLQTPFFTQVGVASPALVQNSAAPAQGNAARLSEPLAPLSCLSYAPYRRAGDAPWHADRPITPEQIREDLRLLQPLTRCVRTYGVEHGLEAVPAIARELGFKVKLGVWIGGDPVGNERGLERGIALAREYRDVVDLLIVGNEVLLRGELSPQALVRLLEKARSGSGIPVAYAEVWEFWQRHAEALRGHVDVVAVHILPYWEDEPIGVEQAAGHVQAVLKRMNEAFAPLPVWLAETGWPAAGRQRGPAVPGLQEQTRFMRDWLQVAPAEYNLIEAFDQPWKRDLEGAMGGHWGILSAKGEPKIHWHGPLPSNIDATALIGALIAGTIAGAISGGLLGMQRARGLVARRRWPWILAGLLAGGCLGPLVMLQVEMILLWSRTSMELVLASVYALASIAVALMAIISALRGEVSVTSGDIEGTPSEPPEQRGKGQGRAHERGLLIGTGVLLALTLVQALALVIDGRYRPLVWPILIAPAASLILAWVSQRHTASRGAAEHRANDPIYGERLPGDLRVDARAAGTQQDLRTINAGERNFRAPNLPMISMIPVKMIVPMATSLAICAVALVANEGLQNTQAVQAGLTWILLAVGAILALRVSRS